AVVAVYIVGVIACAREKRLEQAALLGLCLVPVVFAPANYYIHFIFLLPILGAEAVWLILLGLCAGQYFTTWLNDLTLHFYLASVLLMVALLAILVTMLGRSGWLRAWWATPARVEPAPIVSSASPAPSATTACDPQASPSP